MPPNSQSTFDSRRPVMLRDLVPRQRTSLDSVLPGFVSCSPGWRDAA